MMTLSVRDQTVSRSFVLLVASVDKMNSTVTLIGLSLRSISGLYLASRRRRRPFLQCTTGVGLKICRTPKIMYRYSSEIPIVQYYSLQYLQSVSVRPSNRICLATTTAHSVSPHMLF